MIYIVFFTEIFSDENNKFRNDPMNLGRLSLKLYEENEHEKLTTSLFKHFTNGYNITDDNIDGFTKVYNYYLYHLEASEAK